MRLIGHLHGLPIWEDAALPSRFGVIEADDEEA